MYVIIVGTLLGYLMGLFKYKCHLNPIWSAIYCLEDKEIKVFKKLENLYHLRCNQDVTIPEEAVQAYHSYYESKRWREEGCFDEQGVMRDNRIISFSETRASFPSADEPGKRQCMIY
jgi:hypothetical protein